MPCCKGMHGGARLGAGRPRVDTKEAKVRLTPQECLALKDAGGSRWVRRQLQVMEEMAMMDLELAHYTEEEKKAFAQGWKAAGGFLDDLGNQWHLKASAVKVWVAVVAVVVAKVVADVVEAKAAVWGKGLKVQLKTKLVA